MTNSGCGWIPNATVQFIANLVDVIKVLVPILLILMGSLDFAKAVMSQKEEEIKKSQPSFIQKLIAGVAVFFVLIFISWVFKIIDNADSNLKTGNAIRCINLMLNGGYQAEEIPKDYNYSTCFDKCQEDNMEYSEYLACKNDCWSKYMSTTTHSMYENCLKKYKTKEYCAAYYGISPDPEEPNETPTTDFQDCTLSCILSGQTNDDKCLNVCKKEAQDKIQEIEDSLWE